MSYGSNPQPDRPFVAKHRRRFLPRHRRPKTALSRVKVPLVVMGVLLVTTGSALAGASDPSAPTNDRLTMDVPVADDAYSTIGSPDAVRGTGVKLTASSVPGNLKTTYLKFKVSGLPLGAGDVDATVRITRDDHHLPGPVMISAVASSAWSESTLNARNAPAVGTQLAKVDTTSATTTVAFDLGDTITADGTYTFAVTSASTESVSSFRSKESGTKIPTLVLEYTASGGSGPLPPAPTPTTQPSPTASPKPSPTPSTSPTVAPPAPAPPPPVSTPTGGTLCGASFVTESSGETYQAALSRLDGYYNGLEMVRTYYGGAPSAWPGKINTSKRPINVSFKFNPKIVLSGSQDSYMTNWFATAPRDQDIYWTYYHEPEDNIANGEFNATDYRAAWAHLRALADKAGNPRLKATLVLMSWSLRSQSGRNWRDYYPGRSVVQVMGWDVYNQDLSKKIFSYQDPAAMYSLAISVSKAEGLPFAVAETGAYLEPGDNGTKRAAWLTAMANYLTSQGALYVAYFDLSWPTGDFRLRDAPSQAAWRAFCS